MDSCAKILRRDKHLPGVVTEACGACWLFRSPLGQRNPKPTWHTGHVFSASEKQSRFVVKIALEILATIQLKAKCPITSEQNSSSLLMNRVEIRIRVALPRRSITAVFCGVHKTAIVEHCA